MSLNFSKTTSPKYGEVLYWQFTSRIFSEGGLATNYVNERQKFT